MCCSSSSFVYAIVFVGGIAVPRSVDDAFRAPPLQAVAIDLALLTLFAVQHSVMARPAFKRWWTRYRPHRDRTQYLCPAGESGSGPALWQWRNRYPPWSGRCRSPGAALVVWALCWLGWGIGAGVDVHDQPLRAVRADGRCSPRGGARPQAETGFRTTLFYRVGAPSADAGLHHRVLGGPDHDGGASAVRVGTTGYILIAVRIEERDLTAAFGDEYRQYRRDVPMLVPVPVHRS